MPRQMNLDSFAVMITRIMESLPEDDKERSGITRVLAELAKLGITTVPHEIGLMYANTESSRTAAEAIQKSKGSLCEQVHDYLMVCGKEGATDAEIQEGTGMYYKTQMPRRIELQAARRVVQTGEKRINPDRPNPKDKSKILTGLPAMVWVATEHYDPLGYHSHEEIERRQMEDEKRLKTESYKAISSGQADKARRTSELLKTHQL